MDQISKYHDLMENIRGRFDLINAIRSASADAFSKAETAAFQGRKVIECIAFGCLVAVENAYKYVPHSEKTQWNAADIFKGLRKKDMWVLPNPSIIRLPTESEKVEHNVTSVIEGMPDRCLACDEILEIYSSMHKWLHDINPYLNSDRQKFLIKNEGRLWRDLERLNLMMERHFISIRGEAFYCILHDMNDNQTKLVKLSKTCSLP